MTYLIFLMLALVGKRSHYLGVESLSGNTPQANQPDENPEKLLQELKIIEIWLDIQEAGFADTRRNLELRVNTFLENFDRANEIRARLGFPPRKKTS